MNVLSPLGKVLVTGATGFIGRRLVVPGDRQLLRAGGMKPHGAVVGDLCVPETLRRACLGIDTVFHCAGYAHAFRDSDPEKHWTINFEGTRNLLSAAGEAGVRHFVFLSSVKAMGEPGNNCIDECFAEEPMAPYGKSKRAAEEAVLDAGRRYGMHVVNLRLAMVYGRGGRGNLERMAEGVRHGWFPPLPETNNRRSIVHVSDVVSAIRYVAKMPAANGKTFIVADPNPYSGREIYRAICQAVGQAPRSWSIPAVGLRLGGRCGDILSSILGRPFPLSSEIVSRLLDSACYSPGRIRHELGWTAQVGLVEGLREMLRNETIL